MRNLIITVVCLILSLLTVIATTPEATLSLDTVSVTSLRPSATPAAIPEEGLRNPIIEVEAVFVAPVIERTEPEEVAVPIPVTQTPGVSPILHFIGILILVVSVLGFISTFSILPFSLHAMSSSSSSKPSSSSSKPSSSSSSSSPSSSSSSRPSSSSGSSGSSSSASKPPQPTPYISPNAWMSFFLFCCLVLIILQGPLSLTGGGVPSFPFTGAAVPSSGGVTSLPGCNGFIANAAPWCQQGPTVNVQTTQPIQYQPQYPEPVVPPQMAGQGSIQMPTVNGQYSWYANGQPQPYFPPRRQRRSYQYQAPGVQVQVNGQGSSQGNYICRTYPYMCQPLIPVAYAQKVQAPPPPIVQAPPPQRIVTPLMTPPAIPSAQAVAGLQNLENAFYPLLVGAIALLVIFDYAG